MQLHEYNSIIIWCIYIAPIQICSRRMEKRGKESFQIISELERWVFSEDLDNDREDVVLI